VTGARNDLRGGSRQSPVCVDASSASSADLSAFDEPALWLARTARQRDQGARYFHNATAVERLQNFALDHQWLVIRDRDA
jgi:hypothetical protein